MTLTFIIAIYLISLVLKFACQTVNVMSHVRVCSTYFRVKLQISPNFVIQSRTSLDQTMEYSNRQTSQPNIIEQRN